MALSIYIHPNILLLFHINVPDELSALDKLWCRASCTWYKAACAKQGNALVLFKSYNDYAEEAIFCEIKVSVNAKFSKELEEHEEIDSLATCHVPYFSW